MRTIGQLVLGLALGAGVLCNAACNAITGLDRNYVEVDCFPPGSCSEAGVDASTDGSGASTDGSNGSIDGSVDASVESGPALDASADRASESAVEAMVEEEASPGKLDSGALEASVDAGPDSPTCMDACTASDTKCGSGGVQTCKRQANGCTEWMTTATCGSNQACTVGGTDAGATASCTCKASACTQGGTLCQDPQTLATCAKDADGCYYVASTSTCAMPKSCSGMAPGAACSLTCSDSCTQGQTSCVSGGVATCTLGSNGCRAYGAPMACGAHQSCTGAAGAAACTCNADPVCSAVGSACANATTLATCAKDAQNCMYESASMTCTNGACSSGACCTNGCSPGQTTCVNGALATCTLGANGCWAYATAVACGTHQSCTGAAGAAACTCNASICTSAQNTCADPATLATCAIDAQNCAYESGTMACTNGACSGNKCCTNACTIGATQCSPTSSVQTQSCAKLSNGCSAWTTASTCSAESVCQRQGGISCVDPNWAEWPMPNGPSDVASGAPNQDSYTDNGDGTVTDNVTALVWQQSVAPGAYRQSGGVTYCKALNLGGFTDWRLPSLVELLSLVDPGTFDPSINTTYFPTPPQATLWSSTLSQNISYPVGLLNFHDGSSSFNDGSGAYNVRCVR